MRKKYETIYLYITLQTLQILSHVSHKCKMHFPIKHFKKQNYLRNALCTIWKESEIKRCRKILRLLFDWSTNPV